MSTERIKELHEQASERYLNGDYQGALTAWRDVLGLDPNDEQAIEGSNLASQFVDQESLAASGPKADVERELDQGLKVLDRIGGAPLTPSNTSDGSTDRKPGPGAAVAAPDADDLLEGWEAPAPAPAEDGAFGLAPMAESSQETAEPSSAAAAELSRRVGDLLTEARAKMDAGERDEALAILFRLAILDEDNAEAAKLRAQIEAAGASELERVERAIIEGVAALEGDQLDEAEKFFREALELVPGHREAQHYLEKVEQKRTLAGEELLGAGVGELAPGEQAVEKATAVTDLLPKTPMPKPPRRAPVLDSEPPELALATAGPRSSLGASKLLLWGGISVLVVAVLAVAAPRLIGNGTRSSSVSAASPVPSQKGAPVRPAPRSKAPVPAPVTPTDPQEIARSVASDVAKGQSMMESGDFGGAVVAFNAALTLDPTNAEARAGFDEAGERYKASKSERDAINSIKTAFKDGEFSSGLRVAYRLPPTVSSSFTDDVKVTGWYNLAIVALRAGDCREAMSHLDEALQIAPADSEAKQLREFAARYADAVKDRVFLDRVEALAFRALPAD